MLFTVYVVQYFVDIQPVTVFGVLERQPAALVKLNYRSLLMSVQ